MKKAKIIFSAIAVMAVVAGAFAFKARQLNTFYEVDRLNPNPQLRLCTKQIQTAYTTVEADKAPGAATFTTNLYSTSATPATACPLTEIWTAN